MEGCIERIDARTLADWDHAYGYDQVTSVSWLYRQLLDVHARVEAGTVIVMPDGEETTLGDSRALGAWVRARYPGFADDRLHTAFWEAGGADPEAERRLRAPR